MTTMNATTILPLAVAASLLLSAGAGAATLTLNGTSFEAGSTPTITASFSGHSGGSVQDWIGVYPQGVVPDGDPTATAWEYVDGTQATGSWDLDGIFANPTNAHLGTWTAHFLSDNGYTHVPGVSEVDFDIVPASSITFGSDQATYDLGETVNINWSGNAGVTSTDWVGVYAAGATPGVDFSLTYQYATTASGSAGFSGLAAGDYDIYFLANDGYYQMGQTSITVVPEASGSVLAMVGLVILAVRRRR